MERTLELADEITSSISESEIYKEFIKAKREIMSDSALYDKMKNFKKAHIEFCTRRTSGNEVPIMDEIRVSRMYFELLSYKTAKEYLKNEQLLINLMTNIYEHLSKSCVELFTGFE